MAEVTLHVGGRPYRVACRDGEEAAVIALGRRVDAYAPAAARAAGGQGAERMLLYIALMLADEMAEGEKAPGGGLSPAVIDRIAARLESLATHLEAEAANA